MRQGLEVGMQPARTRWARGRKSSDKEVRASCGGLQTSD